MEELIFLIVLGTSIWAAIDAHQLQAHKYKGYHGAFGTLIGCLTVWLIYFPFYLYKRSALVNRTAVLKPSQFTEAQAQAKAQISLNAAERLQQMADLRDKGVLTEEEFRREKEKILS